MKTNRKAMFTRVTAFLLVCVLCIGVLGSNTAEAATKSISTNYSASKTGSTTSSKYYVKVTGKKTSGTTIKAGTIFYTYTSSGGSGKTTGGSAYYAKVGSSYVYVGAAQCMGFAHYIQYMMYGKYDGTDKKCNSGFKQIATNTSTTSKNAKTNITKAGAGAHIRVPNSKGGKHSLIVVKVTSKGFYYVDANWANKDNQVKIGYYTWSDFAKKYTKTYYIRYYTG